MMKIVTWNVNSIKARLPHVIDWLRKASPDVVMLQELKCTTENFPFQDIEDEGYQCAVFGQKTYNGVAILSRTSIEDVTCGNPFFEDSSARIIDAVIGGSLRVMNVYVPNGQSLDSDKFQYKLNFYEALEHYVKERLTLDESFIIGGDFNVAPQDKDVFNPAVFQNDILCSPQERMAFRSLINLGLTDALRFKHPHSHDMFTWWDYRQGSFQKNNGARIDHLLLSAKATEKFIDSYIDLEPRHWDRPSDHTPMCVDLNI